MAVNPVQKTLILKGLGCANCAAKIEKEVRLAGFVRVCVFHIADLDVPLVEIPAMEQLVADKCVVFRDCCQIDLA